MTEPLHQCLLERSTRFARRNRSIGNHRPCQPVFSRLADRASLQMPVYLFHQ